jgi:hypothetical protein
VMLWDYQLTIRYVILISQVSSVEVFPDGN